MIQNLLLAFSLGLVGTNITLRANESNLQLVGVSKINGMDFVVLKATSGEVFHLWGNEVAPRGIRLVRVNTNDEPSNVTVVVQQGEAVREIGFNTTATIPKLILQDPAIVAHEKSFRRRR